jgi:hypothetical protein
LCPPVTVDSSISAIELPSSNILPMRCPWTWQAEVALAILLGVVRIMMNPSLLCAGILTVATSLVGLVCLLTKSLGGIAESRYCMLHLVRLCDILDMRLVSWRASDACCHRVS